MLNPETIISPRVTEGISVINACKNRQENLGRALKSWIKCKQISEIIIVDWSSTTPVEELTNKYADDRIRVFRVENESRWILTIAYNLAARLSSKAKILKLDCDYVIQPQFFKNCELGKDVFYTGNWRVSEDVDVRALNGCIFVYRSDFFAVNGYNERIKTYGWDDCDLYGRLQAVAKRKDIDFQNIKHLPHSTASRIEHQPISRVYAEIEANRKRVAKNPWTTKDKMAHFRISHQDGRITLERDRMPSP